MSTTLIRYALAHRWALEPSVLRSLCAILNRHEAGERVGPEAIEQVRERRRSEHTFRRHAQGRAWYGVRPRADDGDAGDDAAEPYMVGRALVVPVRGVIAQYSSMVNGISQPQGMAADRLQSICQAAAQDPAVASVILHIDSPGGTVAGISDAVSAVRALAAVKHVHAHANDLMASAALWIGSQASEVSTTPTGMVGSIGVYAVVEDTSEAYAAAGVKRILIASGEHKGAGTDGVPVTDGQIEGIGAECMALSSVFVGDVATGRGMSPEAVAALADGRTYVGEEARRLGLVDRVCGLDEVIEQAREGGTGYGPNTRNQAMSNTNTGAIVTKAEAPTEDKPEDKAPEALTLADLKVKYPALMDEHAAEIKNGMAPPVAPEEEDDAPAPKEEAATVAQIKAAFPEDPAFRALCIEDGLSMAAAQDRYIATLKQQLTDARAEADRVKPKANGAAPTTFAAAGSGNGPADYAAAVGQIVARDKVKREVAMARAATAYPALHKAWTEAGCPAIA